MTLRELLERAARSVVPDHPGRSRRAPRHTAAPTSTGIAYDSRRVTPGCGLRRARGPHDDGTRFARAGDRARRRCHRGGVRRAGRRTRCRGCRSLDARGCARGAGRGVLRRSERRAALVGITGTNGKTTTAYLLAVDLRGRRHPLRANRHGRLPHRRTRDRGHAHDARSAGPAAAARATWSTGGCGACAMEVSSHALALRRVDGLRVRRRRLHEPDARPPRLPRDMDAYFQAKRRLFEMLPDGAVGVVNLDDPRGAALAAAAAGR